MSEHQRVIDEDDDLKRRPVGVTEHSWCRAVSCGTGITVLALLVSKSTDVSLLQNALHNLQNSHPVLRSKLQYSSSNSTFFFSTPSIPTLKIHSIDLTSTSHPLHRLHHHHSKPSHSPSPFHTILEHELNTNPWSSPSHWPSTGVDVLFATVYSLPDPSPSRVAVLRLHTAVCDRTTGVSLLRELMELAMADGGKRKSPVGIVDGGEGSLGIEDMVPADAKSKKTIWAHGKDILGYSVSSLRLTNLKFKDCDTSSRFSQVVRFQMSPHDTNALLTGCKLRGIKLCGALAAAGMMAAHSSKYGGGGGHRKKYGVVTLIDCRSLLHPSLSSHHFGFYHSAIMNVHVVKGGEKLWEMAEAAYGAFAESKKANKHLTDMADLNFLMRRAIDNPGLTPSSSLRTSLLSVFEDPVVDSSSVSRLRLGVDDYVGCSSAHGIGPSLALFDTVTDGRLDCSCVFPAPLHSRDQVADLLDRIKTILVDASSLAYLVN